VLDNFTYYLTNHNILQHNAAHISTQYELRTNDNIQLNDIGNGV
jgi:hypothetical protein